MTKSTPSPGEHFTVHGMRQTGPRTPAWEELWRRITREVLAESNQHGGE